ncbi:hypothetical protein NMG60_11026131 [Bertholletia excelsa]
MSKALLFSFILSIFSRNKLKERKRERFCSASERHSGEENTTRCGSSLSVPNSTLFYLRTAPKKSINSQAQLSF